MWMEFRILQLVAAVSTSDSFSSLLAGECSARKVRLGTGTCLGCLGALGLCPPHQQAWLPSMPCTHPVAQRFPCLPILLRPPSCQWIFRASWRQAHSPAPTRDSRLSSLLPSLFPYTHWRVLRTINLSPCLGLMYIFSGKGRGVEARMGDFHQSF